MSKKNGTLMEVIESWFYGREDEWTTSNGSLYHKDDVLYSYGDHFPLALRVNGGVLVNGDSYSVSTSKHQSYLFSVVGESYRVEIPFSALDKAISGRQGLGGYSLNMEDLKENLTIIDSTSDQYIDTGRVSEKTGETIYKHQLGACIFSYKDRYFFSGIDETGKGVHSYFLTELTRPVYTVADGLDCMTPFEVIEAEKEGKDIHRQGEWFFVKCDVETDTNLSNMTNTKDYVLRGDDGDTGHHKVSNGLWLNDCQYVKGIVKHTEGDHKQVKLYEDTKDRHWFRAYHNIQVMSYNSLGNVD